MHIFYRRYAMFLVMSPNSNLDAIEKMIHKLTDLIGENNMEKYENMGVKSLAYTLEKNNTALFLQIYFKLPDDDELGYNIQNIKVQFSSKRNDNILRSLVLTANHNEFHFKNLKSYNGFEPSAIK